MEQTSGCVTLLWVFTRHCAHHVLLAEVGIGTNVWLCLSSLGLYSPCAPGRGRDMYWNKRMAVLTFFGSLLGIVLTMYSWQRWVLEQTYGCVYLLWVFTHLVLLAEVEVCIGTNEWLCLSSLGLYSALCSQCMAVFIFFGSLLGIVLTVYFWQR